MDKLKGLDLEGKRVLDAGTGGCNMTTYLEKWGAEVISVDLRDDWQEQCREKTVKTQFVTADLIDMPFLKDDVFDYIVCNFVISALTQKKGTLISPALREFYRVLKKGGMLIVIDYYPFEEGSCPSPIDELHMALWRLENAVAELRGEGHLLEFSPNSLKKELEAIGFTKVDISTLVDRVVWPQELLEEHKENLLEDIEGFDDELMKKAFKRRLHKIMGKTSKRELRSGSIYELRAKY